MAHAPQVHNRHHLLLASYEEEARKTNRLTADAARDQLRFGFFGEVGGVLALVKKSHRDLAPADHHAITEELGDALWYLANVAHAFGSSLQFVGHQAMTALHQRMNVGQPVDGPLSFEQFDGLLTLCHAELVEDKAPALLRSLAGKTGQLLALDDLAKGLFTPAPEQLLGELFADLAMVAHTFKQRIAFAAEANISKVQSRWPGEDPKYLPLFDENRQELEQFPRKLSMHFIERTPTSGRPYVIQRLNGVNIGDRLTDNRASPDGYRFHDVFHLAYLTHLGWSPVIRSLLKLKRKSTPDVDENEDGARAMIIEEGIATWIFNHAHHRRYFADVKPGRLDYGMLKQALDMVSGYEVDQCPLWQWEQAILDGFRIFRLLVESGSGIVHLDLNQRTMTLEPLPVTADPPPRAMARQVPVGAMPPPLDGIAQTSSASTE